MNKKNKLMTRLRYTYIPMPARVILSNLGTLGHSLSRHYPLSAPSGHLSCQPVFIISAGRSGSTLLRSMLVAGGQIAIPAETQMIHLLPLKFITSRGLGWEDQARLIITTFESHHNFPLWQINLADAYQRVLALPEAERALARIIDEVFMTYAAQAFPEAKVWGDQSPIHALYLPYIDKIFPQAKYIHLLRDGRDVVASKVVKNGDESLYSAVHRWKTCIKRTKQFRKQVNPEQYLEIRYENLVREPETTLQQVSGFIGIKFSSRMLDYWKLPSTVEHKYKSYHQNLGKPVFSTSVGSWQDRLSTEQLVFVMNNLSTELQELGYPNPSHE